MAFTAVDFVNIKSDYEALKKQFDIMSQCIADICALMSRIEYFVGHFEDSQLEDDLPL